VVVLVVLLILLLFVLIYHKTSSLSGTVPTCHPVRIKLCLTAVGAGRVTARTERTACLTQAQLASTATHSLPGHFGEEKQASCHPREPNLDSLADQSVQPVRCTDWAIYTNFVLVRY
jgi:hypothetical protein